MIPTPTLAQTLVMLALSQGEQPWIAPAVRTNLIRRRWMVQRGTRPVRGGRELPSWGLTDGGEAVLNSSPHLELARTRLKLGLQKSPWL